VCHEEPNDIRVIKAADSLRRHLLLYLLENCSEVDGGGCSIDGWGTGSCGANEATGWEK